jgi:hypothetical protein
MAKAWAFLIILLRLHEVSRLKNKSMEFMGWIPLTIRRRIYKF